MLPSMMIHLLQFQTLTPMFTEISILTLTVHHSSPTTAADCHVTAYYHNKIKQQTLEIILICNLCQLLVRFWRYMYMYMYVTKCEKVAIVLF